MEIERKFLVKISRPFLIIVIKDILNRLICVLRRPSACAATMMIIILLIKAKGSLYVKNIIFLLPKSHMNIFSPKLTVL